MVTMADGSPMLPSGTYVRVVRQEVRDAEGEVVFPAQTFIARVVGTDMFRSKYEVAPRYAGWAEWLFLDGGDWAFIGEVTAIDEAEALAPPEGTS